MAGATSKVHVLDLFCGNGQRLIQLAQRHPRKTFVGVDKSKRWTSAALPANVSLVKHDVLEFLRSRNQGGLVRQVVIDYGVHHLPLAKRRQLYAHLMQLIVPGGSLHITTYNQSGDVSPEKIIQEAVNAGFSLHSRKPLLETPGASQSQYSALRARGQGGLSDVFGAPTVPTSTRLHFRVPRKTSALAASLG